MYCIQSSDDCIWSHFVVYSPAVIANYLMRIIFFQMSAYFAPAFFSHLLGKCLRRKHPILEVLKLGLFVLGTFAAVWWPYLYSTQSILEVTMLSLPGTKCICILNLYFCFIFLPLPSLFPLNKGFRIFTFI